MPTLKVNFKSPKQAKEFSKNFGVVGLKSTVEVKGSTVVITSKDKKTHEFVKQMVSDLKSEIKIEAILNRFVSTIIESSEQDATKCVELYDGSVVSVDADFARKFIRIHDSIHEECSSSSLLILATESSESFDKVIEFVNQKGKA